MTKEVIGNISVDKLDEMIQLLIELSALYGEYAEAGYCDNLSSVIICDNGILDQKEFR